jgi:hypothetical protein
MSAITGDIRCTHHPLQRRMVTVLHPQPMLTRDEIGGSLERRQFWKWITMPTITIGAATATAKNGDNVY